MLTHEERSEKLDAIDRYLVEAHALLQRTEECEAELRRNGACEGHLFLAAQTLRAMRRLQATVEQSRISVAALPSSPLTPAIAVKRSRRWWLRLLPRRSDFIPEDELPNEGLN